MPFRSSLEAVFSSAVVAIATVGETTTALVDDDNAGSSLPVVHTNFVPRKLAAATGTNTNGKINLAHNDDKDTKRSFLPENQNTSPSSMIKNSVVDNPRDSDYSMDFGILADTRDGSPHGGDNMVLISKEIGNTETIDPAEAQPSRELLVSCYGNNADCPYAALLMDCDSCPERPLLAPDANMAKLLRACNHGYLNIYGAYNDEEYCPYGEIEIGCWDISQVEDMTVAFYNQAKFNKPLNCWDTSSVTSMRSMFNGATSFNQPINMWNTASVIDMNGMFYLAMAFNQPIGDWNTTSVSNMRRMFGYASEFNNPIGKWQTQNLEDISIMFAGASAFNQPIDRWQVSSVIFYSSMFRGASAFNQCLSPWSTKMSNGILNWVMFENSGCPYNGHTTGLGNGPWCQGDAQGCFSPCERACGCPREKCFPSCDQVDDYQCIGNEVVPAIASSGGVIAIPNAATSSWTTIAVASLILVHLPATDITNLIR